MVQYAHRIWGQDEGLFQPTVYSILQARDGVLWLGTQDSLIRFDGVHFREFDDSPQAPLHRSLVRDLAEDASGALWAASIGSGLLRISPEGDSTHYTQTQGLPSNDVFCVDTTAANTLWACTNRGLAKFNGRAFQTFSTANGLPTNAIRATCQAKDGTRWVAGLDFGLARSIGSRFESYHLPFAPQTSVTALHCGRDGAIWAGTDAGLVRIAAGTQTHITTKDGLPDNVVLSLHESRDGTIWIGTNDGITRWHNGEISVFRTSDGLSHSSVLSLYEDGEGTLWAGTKDGLDQFADGKLTPFTHHEGLSSDDIGPVLEDKDDRLWIGTLGRGLNLRDHGRLHVLTTTDGLAGNTILSLELDRAGDLWIGTSHGLSRWRQGAVVDTFRRRDGLSGDEVRTIFSDSEGTLWVGTDRGIDRWDGHRFQHADRLFSADPIGGVLAINGGRLAKLLVSTETQGVFALRNGVATRTNLDLVRAVDCYFFDKVRGETWMGTLGSGLLRYRNGVFTHVRVKDGLYDNRIYGIVQDDHANLWLASSKGIFRVSQQQLDDFAEGKLAYVTSLPFSTGQLRFECQSGVQPAAARTRDGRLWFSTNNGLVMIDPNHLATNPVPPPVTLTGIFVNGRRVKTSDGNELRLNPQERNIELRYAGLSFVSPERVTFRYMLKGYETSWISAGARREAFYTNLPPGPFEFQVSARNADGIWSKHPASFRFYVTPRLYQRVWFFPSVIALLGLAVAAIYRARVSGLRRTFSIILSERSRIARELHDTLLQGISGVTMQLQALWSALPPSHERDLLSEIIQDAGRCSKEARRSLWGLRGLGSDPATFTDKLARVAREAVGPACQLQLHLQPVSLEHLPDTEYQLLRIASEAIVNALRHAEAETIEVSLITSAGEIRIAVKDDGIGFVPNGEQAFGHYGLMGMRERAEEIGAEMEIVSGQGQGTTVSVRLNRLAPSSNGQSKTKSQITHQSK